MNLVEIRTRIHSLQATTQETTLKAKMVEPPGQYTELVINNHYLEYTGMKLSAWDNIPRENRTTLYHINYFIVENTKVSFWK